MSQAATLSYVQPAYSAAVEKTLARKPQLYING